MKMAVHGICFVSGFVRFLLLSIFVRKYLKYFSAHLNVLIP